MIGTHRGEGPHAGSLDPDLLLLLPLSCLPPPLSVSQITNLESALGLYKEALTHEKRAYSIFTSVLGPKHARSLESSQHMSAFTAKAVEQAKPSATTAAALGNGPKKGEDEDSWTADLEGRAKGGAGKKKKAGSKRK